MSTRTNMRRIYTLFDRRFHGKSWWRSAEEQAWLAMAPVGREFGSPDYDRLQILDLYAASQMSGDDAMRNLGLDSLEDLHQLVLAADLIVPRPDAMAPPKGMFAGKATPPVSIGDMNRAPGIAAALSERMRKK